MDNKYKSILDSYAKRLISTNSRTRSIYYSKDDKSIEDISRLMSLVGIDELESFLRGEIDSITLDYGAVSTERIFQLFDDFIEDELEKINIVKEYPMFTKTDFELLKKKGKDVYTELYNKYEKIKKSELYNLLDVKEKNDSIKKTLGKNDLYIGYPYIQGQFNKDKVVRAPLILHKVTLDYSGEKIIVSNENTRLLNPVFIMSYLVENNLIYKDKLDFEILEDEYMPIVFKILNNIGIKYEDKTDSVLSKMVKLTKKEFKDRYKYNDNNFEIYSCVTLGIFPISDKKIYDDVVELRDNEEINEMLNKFYDKETEVKVFDDEDKDVEENKLKYITVLDYSQKKTLQEALSKNAIIQGPPGTGKSQVIVNIAANCLLNRERVLFCSEKRTATDVIYNRLGKLSSFALLLHDNVSEKEHFYNSISNAIQTAKENIAKYKWKAFSFNEDYKIKAFFDNSKRYNEIINNNYRGLSYFDIMQNKDKECLYNKEFMSIDNFISNINELYEHLYKYESSEKFINVSKRKKELSKDFYKEYEFSFDDDRLLNIEEFYNKVNSLSNNYLKNIMISNFLKKDKSRVSFFKRIFCKNEELSELSKEFFDSNKHDFSVFNLKLFDDYLEKAIFTLKFIHNLDDEEIINNYKIYLSQLLYRDIDVSFMEEYTSNYENNMKEVFACMDSKKDESIEFIARSCSADIKEKLSDPKYNDLVQKLLGEINRKRKPPIKVIVDEYFEVLQIIFPIWIMTPDVVSATVPLRESVFNKVIFDEASQLFIEKAVPSIARADSVIICGDSKQLRPTLFFESRYDESDEDVYLEVEQETALTETSLLDYATTSNKYVSSMLSYHYRCYYKELINFSNYAFYNGNLTFASNSKGNELLPIETINVEGEWDGEKNVVEAKNVVSLVKDLLLNRKEEETIGIVTLNVNQRDLILDYLNDETRRDKQFGSLYNAERIRRDNDTNEDESIFVKNLESVQGDERDIIIFSISYSKNSKGSIGSALGEIQRQYGENRLNVAISRAKKKVYIVKSFMGNDLEINEDNRGPSYFKKYLQYADCLNSHDIIGANNILNSLSILDRKLNDINGYDYVIDEVSKIFEENLDSTIYSIRRDVNVGSFVFDIAVYKDNKYLFGLELSGIDYYSNPSEVSNDIYKHYYLMNRGWNIYKLWISDWLINKDNEIIKIKEYLNSI